MSEDEDLARSVLLAIPRCVLPEPVCRAIALSLQDESTRAAQAQPEVGREEEDEEASFQRDLEAAIEAAHIKSSRKPTSQSKHCYVKAFSKSATEVRSLEKLAFPYTGLYHLRSLARGAVGRSTAC